MRGVASRYGKGRSPPFPTQIFNLVRLGDQSYGGQLDRFETRKKAVARGQIQKRIKPELARFIPVGVGKGAPHPALGTRHPAPLIRIRE
jgi:hypothetical protein